MSGAFSSVTFTDGSNDLGMEAHACNPKYLKSFDRPPQHLNGICSQSKEGLGM